MFWAGCTPEADSLVLRVATFNLEDVRTEDVLNPDQPRLKAAAALLQRLRPDVVLLNEVAYDEAEATGAAEGTIGGQNGRRFAELFLGISQGEGLAPLRYEAFSAPSNTGLASGLDLDNDGRIVRRVPKALPPEEDGSPGPQTDEGRAYGNDSWGFGTFPGQYGMVLLVREGLELLRDSVRTFRLLPWSRMPGALHPVEPETGEAWYGQDVWPQVRLSSKSHWDVPVRVPGGRIIHFLCSHPTPPAFDGPEERNKRRNHDEIRFWADYLDGAAYLEDDSSRAGGLATGASFVILGDLNADPDEGAAVGNPINNFLLRHPRINSAFTPRASEQGQEAYPDLDPDDTARWGLRVDYVLPSQDLRILDGGVWRPDSTATPVVSDHFPVWLDIEVDPLLR